MPRKTRKQKARADERRSVMREEPMSIKPLRKKEEPVSTKPRVKEGKKEEASTYESQLTAFTLSDLKKTAIISAGILALEFFVFFARLKIV